MRSILLCLAAVMVMFSAMPAFAQNQTEETVMVKKSDLPSDLIAKLDQEKKVEQITDKFQAAQEWAGMGKEIGIAVNDGLKAVTEQTASFSKTDVGQLTMFLVAWKVLAKDFTGLLQLSLGLVVGIPMLIFANWFAIFYYRRTYVGRNVKKTSEGWLWWKKVTYEYHKPAIADWGLETDDIGRVIVIVLFWLALFIANAWIIAGCIF